MQKVSGKTQTSTLGVCLQSHKWGVSKAAEADLQMAEVCWDES